MTSDAKTNGKHETSPSVVRSEKRDNLIAASFAGVGTSDAKKAAARVTEFNVGRWCLSEDECIAQGIDFAAYERGVADAADAFGRNRETEDAASWLLEQRLITYAQLLAVRAALASADPASDLARAVHNREVTR